MTGVLSSLAAPGVLAHGGHLHPWAWAAIAVGALVPLVAVVVIVVLTERRR